MNLSFVSLIELGLARDFEIWILQKNGFYSLMDNHPGWLGINGFAMNLPNYHDIKFLSG